LLLYDRVGIAVHKKKGQDSRLDKNKKRTKKSERKPVQIGQKINCFFAASETNVIQKNNGTQVVLN
jgi:hypothetical protein